MMTCKEVLEALSSYLDEELRQEIATEMKRHIGNCSDCRAEFDTLSFTIRLYHHDPRPTMPADCHDRLIKVLELEKLKQRSGTESSGS